MLSSGSTPRVLLASLLQANPGIAIRTSDLRNEREKVRQDYLRGRTPIHALVNELDTSENWISSIQVDDSRRVRSLLFAHVSQVELYHTNPCVLTLDCTYRTNRYNMPLLHFLGVSPIGKYFSTTFYFLSGETEEDYDWAIHKFIKRILPSAHTALEAFYNAPNIIITDNEATLKLVLKRRFTSSFQLLYI